MAWNGWKVVDMDSHIMERPHEMYDGYVDPSYQADFERLKLAIEENIRQGGKGALAASRHAILAPVISDNALGQADSFGLAPREFILQPGAGGRPNFGRPDRGNLPHIRPEVNWDVKARLEDMDAAHVDVGVLYPTHVSSYCALHDVGFENAMYMAYHRWVSDFCSQAPERLKWTLVANLTDARTAASEIRRWAKEDDNLVGIYFSPQGPDNLLLDSGSLYPIYEAAEETDLPVLIHGGTARPPFGPGTFDLRGAWFLQHALGNPWAGMAAMGALIGGGIMERFPTMRAAIVETAAGWLPAISGPIRQPLCTFAAPRSLLEAVAHRDGEERAVFPRHRHVGDHVGVGGGRGGGGRSAVRDGLAPRRYGMAYGRGSGSRVAGTYGQRQTEDLGGERHAPLPPPARLTW